MFTFGAWKFQLIISELATINNAITFFVLNKPCSFLWLSVPVSSPINNIHSCSHAIELISNTVKWWIKNRIKAITTKDITRSYKLILSFFRLASFDGVVCSIHYTRQFSAFTRDCFIKSVFLDISATADAKSATLFIFILIRCCEETKIFEDFYFVFVTGDFFLWFFFAKGIKWRKNWNKFVHKKNWRLDFVN